MTTISVNEYGLFPREKYLRLYHLLTRSRFLNDKLEWLKESTRKIHGPVLLSQGQEHITVGAMFALEDLGIADQSWVGISHRDQPLFTCKGPEFELELIKNHLQKETSWSRGHDGNTHIGSRMHKIIPFGVSHMGASVAISVGVAEALRDMEYPEISDSKRRPVVLVFFGDGAAQQGCIHEAFNMAAASNAEIEEYEWEIFRPFFDAISEKTERMYGAPVVFILNNNEYAITTRARDQHGRSHLVRRADGYANMLGIEVSEKDPVSVYHAVCKGIRRAQRLEGATLIVCHSYRLGGHNTSEERTYMAQDELVVARANDPVRIFTSFLTDLRMRSENPPYEEKYLFTVEELRELDNKNRQEIDELAGQALNEPDAVPPRDEELLKFMFMPHASRAVNAPVSHDVPRKRMRYREAIIHALRYALLNNPKFRLLGEDVRDPRGGVLALTKGLSTEFGPRRVRNTPLSEFAIVGSAVGQALYGLPVFAEMQFAPFVTSAMTLVAYSIPTSYPQNQINLPMVLMMPYGVVGPGGSGNEHSHSMESWFYHTHGWKIVFPSDAFDACGLLLAAIEDPNPVMFFAHIRANNDSEFAAEVPLEPFPIPIGKASIKRSGSDLTVVAYGAAVRAALNTAMALEREKNISLEVIDLRSIVPLDMETIENSIKKTGRVVIMHEASRTGGVGESIASKIGESEAFSYIKTLPPVTILAAKDYPVPSAYTLEWDRLPFEEVPGNRIDPKADADLKRLFSKKLYDAACSLKAF